MKNKKMSLKKFTELFIKPAIKKALNDAVKSSSEKVN